jgi:LmbE family N-acetylglucosaminyl deacetylase
MQSFNLNQIKKVLCLGAHSDDIEIGCGGVLLKLTRENPDIDVRWVVFSAGGKRTAEAKQSAQGFLRSAARRKVEVKKFRTSFFPFEGEQIKEFFESLKSFQPDLVFTHYRDDRHQDHRVLSDLTWNTFRNHLVLEFEVPKFDGDFGVPNLFVPLSDALAKEKVERVCRHFRTQSNKHWFSEETFLAVMRLRGMECCAKYAEAFYARKITCI